MRRGHPQGSSGPSPPSPSHPPHRYSSPVVPSALVMLPGPCTHQATLSALTRTGLCLHIGHHLCVRRNGCCLRRRLEAGGRVLSLRQQPCRLGVTCCCGRCNRDAQAAGQGDRGGFGWRGQRRGAHKLQRGRGRTQVRERRGREESPYKQLHRHPHEQLPRHSGQGIRACGGMHGSGTPLPAVVSWRCQRRSNHLAPAQGRTYEHLATHSLQVPTAIPTTQRTEAWGEASALLQVEAQRASDPPRSSSSSSS